MAAPKASTLFHFTKKLSSLKGILLKKFYPHYCLEDLSWQYKPRDYFIAFPLVSFCDIPIGRISEHVKFYGSYGIGMSRQWGEAKGLNPVLYVSDNSPIVGSIRKTFEGAAKLKKDHKQPDYLDRVRHFAAFMKPIIGTTKVKGKPVQKEFYLENEWRYVAQASGLKPYLKREEYEDETMRKKWNAEAEIQGKLEFFPGDVRYIFVPQDADIPKLVNFFDRELGSLASNEHKLLMTRITSLEHLERDM